MKKLKQTLGKEEPKKPKDLNYSSVATIGKRSQRSDLNSILLCKSPSKSINEVGLDNFVTNIIQNSVKNSDTISIDRIVKEIIQKCKQNEKFNAFFQEKAYLNKTIENQQLKKLQQIKQLVEQILKKNEQKQKNNELVRIFYQQLGKVIRNKNKITRKQKLDEYDRLIKLLSPRKKFKTQKGKQLLDLSSNNLKVKVTKQEYQIKRQQSHDSSIRIGSQGKRVKTSGSSHSAFKSQNGHEKLRKLMQKQPSLKIIKTKVQYDYSAILQASKSKIQTRNKNVTTAHQGKSSGNDITSKLNKAKKNEAFVFYRPKPHVKKQQR